MALTSGWLVTIKNDSRVFVHSNWLTAFDSQLSAEEGPRLCPQFAPNTFGSLSLAQLLSSGHKEVAGHHCKRIIHCLIVL